MTKNYSADTSTCWLCHKVPWLADRCSADTQRTSSVLWKCHFYGVISPIHRSVIKLQLYQDEHYKKFFKNILLTGLLSSPLTHHSLLRSNEILAASQTCLIFSSPGQPHRYAFLYITLAWLVSRRRVNLLLTQVQVVAQQVCLQG